MNKQLISNPAFAEPKTTGSPVSFNLISETTSLFDPKPLEAQEEMRVQKLLFENFPSSDISEERENAQIAEDFQQIKTLTAEIKGIQKQNLILIGQRIESARAILKNYKEGTFTKWLKEIFASKQTGYNILAYYLFFTSLPVELKEAFKRLPQKTAYLLASRKGEMQEKMEILKNSSSTPEDILPSLRDKLPLSASDKRKTKGSTPLLLDTMLKSAEKLTLSDEPMTEVLREKVKTILSLLEQILAKADAHL